MKHEEYLNYDNETSIMLLNYFTLWFTVDIISSKLLTIIVSRHDTYLVQFMTLFVTIVKW